MKTLNSMKKLNPAVLDVFSSEKHYALDGSHQFILAILQPLGKVYLGKYMLATKLYHET